ncbi:MAG: GNAT family N-acetyltransferase [Anaerolineae bacterium]
MAIEIRVLTENEEFEAVTDIEIAVWDVHPRDAIPPHFLRATETAGGVTLGAFEHDKMVGMAMAFPAYRDGKVFLWSHMTGVLPDQQRQDIGFSLKQAQRVWALEHGLDQIRWTFDPFLRGNANFNLHRLRAVAYHYYVNFYGDMMDGLNKGLPTDRLEACWNLLDARVVAASNGMDPPESPAAFLRDHLLLSVGENQEPVAHSATATSPLLVEIPLAARSLPMERQLAWRFSVRSAIAPHLANGWYAHGFHHTAHHAWYELLRI